MTKEKTNKLTMFFVWEFAIAVGIIFLSDNQQSQIPFTNCFIAGQLVVVYLTFFPPPESRYGVGTWFRAKDLPPGTGVNRNEAWKDSNRYML